MSAPARVLNLDHAKATVRIGLVGYGVGGREFHAPYIAASSACDFAGIVIRSSERAKVAAKEYPLVPVFPSLAEMAAAGVDAVTISTPPDTRVALVEEALELGLHVIADKPFAPTATAGAALAAIAAARGLLLNVFHNRRFDGDIVTARSVLNSGKLGMLRRLDLRCDQDEPHSLELGPTGGLLRDLGSHVVDQAMSLCGPVAQVQAWLDWTDSPAGATDCGFILLLEHEQGARSLVSSSKLSRFSSRELRLHGTEGSYRSDFRDNQIDAIRAGLRPMDQATEWGVESPERWGVLATTEGEQVIVALPGNYTKFYDEFAAAVLTGGAGPAAATHAINVLRVLDAARVSDDAHRGVPIGTV